MSEQPDLSNVNITLEQILAAILSSMGTIQITLDDMLKDYSDKRIAVNQDPDSNNLYFELVDINQAESE